MKSAGAALFAMGVAVAIASEPSSVIMFRDESSHELDQGLWERRLKSFAANPGCCDQIWFSTGVGLPPLSWHEAQAHWIAKIGADARALGIEPSLQFQLTVGHGDDMGTRWDYSGKTWRGFVGRGGCEAKKCSCPRQGAFLDYMRRCAAIYAAIGPVAVWIDDDLRIGNHHPVSPWNKMADGWWGCFCPDCLEAFGRETGRTWTREELDAALDADRSLSARWERFSVAAVANVARVIGEEFHRISPKTMLAYQYCSQWEHLTTHEVFAALHKAGCGAKIGARVGGTAWDDVDPNSQLIKGFRSARNRKEHGDPDAVGVWCQELESWPRAYGMRCAQSAIVEALASVAFGMNAVSYLLLTNGQEPEDLYERHLLKPLAAALPLVKRYIETNRGTRPAGFSADEMTPAELYYWGLSGVPVLPGPGTSYGSLSKKDRELAPWRTASGVIQSVREELDGRTGGRVAAVVKDPFIGLIVPRVTEDGCLRTVALFNTKIDVQGPVRIAVRGVPAAKSAAVWRELRRDAKPLEVVRAANGEVSVTVPEIGAWNAGFVDFSDK